MAKSGFKNDKVEKVEKVEVQAESVQAEAPQNDPQPLQKQEALHAAYNYKAALQPGREPVQGEGLMGEVEYLAQKAEADGKAELAGELHNLAVKIGALLSHVNELEEKTAEHVKPLYLKIISFFKK